MSDLPSREMVKNKKQRSPLDRAIVAAYVGRELLTVEELRETIDYEAAQTLILKRWEMLKEPPATPELRIWLWALVEGILDAALPDLEC